MEKKVCVVGAGASGLSAVKACIENELDVICYEKTENLGGLWRYRSDNIEGVGSIWKSVVSTTSKEMSAFSDFPPRINFPNFMGHKEMLIYLEDYADSFKLLPYLEFGSEVQGIEKSYDFEDTGKWSIKVQQKDGRVRNFIFDYVMVCTGSFCYPHIPVIPGIDTYTGRLMHTHFYKSYTGFEDKKILVVGLGTSATNTAVELANFSNKLPIYVSTRKGAWIVSRLSDGGLPRDILHTRRYLNFLFKWLLPRSFASDFYESKANQKIDHNLFKIQPPYRIFEQGATVEDDLGSHIMSGRIQIKGELDRFTPNGVIFKDEVDELSVDVVILATGFEHKIPFLDDNILHLVRERVELFQFIFPITLNKPTLAIIGMVQPLGASIPVTEMQSRWTARVFSGRCTLPTLKQMQVIVNAYNCTKRRNHYETDWIKYMDALAGYIGAKPDFKKMMWKDPKLFYACYFGPLAPYQYRLKGPNSWANAREAILSVNDRVLFPLRSRKSSIVAHRLPGFEVCVILMMTIMLVYYLLF